MNEQILGLITGIFFGFLLQKGRVLRFEKQISALLFRDMTIVKFMLSAIITGMIGFYLLRDFGIIVLKHKTMNLGAVTLGGALFGTGWALVGFCPGTSIGALGEGRWHALWAIAGMLAGAALFAETYPFLKQTVLSWKSFGDISLAEALHMNTWLMIVLLTAVYLGICLWFEKKHI